MFYYRTQEQKQEQMAELSEQVTFLFKVSSLCKSRAFKKFFASNESRLECVDEVVHEKIRENATYQFTHFAPIGARRDLPHLELLSYFAQGCEDKANEMVEKFDLKILKKNRIYKFNSCLMTINELFKDKPKTSGRVYDATNSFYQWNGICALNTYLEARLTIEKETPNVKFEAFLQSLTPKYLAKGYPNDLLAHDASEIRTRSDELSHILYQEDYCSTHMVLKTSNVREGHGNGFATLALS